MRWMFSVVVGAIVLTFAFPGEAGAQARDCGTYDTQEERIACASDVLRAIEARAPALRAEAGQSAEDNAYFADRRARCTGEIACIVNTYQVEFSEIQARTGAFSPRPAAPGYAASTPAQGANRDDGGASFGGLLAGLAAMALVGAIMTPPDHHHYYYCDYHC